MKTPRWSTAACACGPDQAIIRWPVRKNKSGSEVLDATAHCFSGEVYECHQTACYDGDRGEYGEAQYAEHYAGMIAYQFTPL